MSLTYGYLNVCARHFVSTLCEMVDREMVHAIIKDNKVVVFSKTWCPHCSSTKKTFNELGVNFKLMELDKTEDGDIIQDILVEVTGARTVLCLALNLF